MAKNTCRNGPHDLRRMPLGHSVTDLRHDRGHGHHERQVAQELELSRRSVWLVDGARRHRDPERDRAGAAPGSGSVRCDMSTPNPPARSKPGPAPGAKASGPGHPSAERDREQERGILDRHLLPPTYTPEMSGDRQLHGRTDEVRELDRFTPSGVQQGIYPLLVTYQALRITVSDAVLTRPDADPDRASFTVALNTARDQLVAAMGVLTDAADAVVDLAGVLGRTILHHLLPERGSRTNQRVVNRAIPVYAANTARGRARAPSPKTAIIIDISSAVP